MDGLKLIESTRLYTLLNQYLLFSNLSNPRYLLLLDARNKEDYDECHIIMAKRMKTVNGKYVVPYDSELECQENVIVYDSNTDSLDSSSPAVRCAEELTANRSRNPVQIVNGGYELFSRLYPFLRTQQMLWTPRELDAYHPFPLEIIPQSLYLGNSRHACDKYVQKQLKIKAHINCTTEPNEIFSEVGVDLFEVTVSDKSTSDISIFFNDAAQFIDRFVHEKKGVLIYSDLGISRSVTMAIAYLMRFQNYSLQNAWNYMKSISTVMRPNRAFVEQLAAYEIKIGLNETNIDDPNF